MVKYTVYTNAEAKTKATTDSLVEARRLAVKMLIKQNHRHSYAKILEEANLEPAHLKYVVQTTGTYAQPLKAYQKGYDFIVLQVTDNGWKNPMAIDTNGQYKRK